MAEEIKKEAYVELDNNMKIETNINKPDVAFYDVRKAPFEIYGAYEPTTEPYFHRLPTNVGKATSARVSGLEQESSGTRVRFSTDSAYIAIKVEFVKAGKNSHIPLAESAGFDLYTDTEYDSKYTVAFLPPFADIAGGELTYESVVDLKGERRERFFTINFPIHSVVKNLYVGIQKDATLGEGMPYKHAEPIVIYGSSIVHGTAASRPGLTYTNMLCRKLNADVQNYGFSGNAKAEDAIINYLRTLPMSVFVLDYDHNAPNAEYLRNTHLRAYQRFREVRPDVPVVIISSPNVIYNKSWSKKSSADRRSVVMDTLKYAYERGDKKVYYIDGETFFMGHEENDCTMDTVHPNDMGFSKMADSVAAIIKVALSDIENL